MLKKFLRICFIANITLACFLQISCLQNNKNTKSNLQSVKAKESSQNASSVSPMTNENQSSTASTLSTAEQLKPKLEKKKFRVTERRCGHDHLPRPKLIPNRIYNDLSRQDYARMYAAADWSPIRIYFDYSKLDSQVTEVSIEKVELLKRLMNRAKEILEKLLKVKRLTRRLVPVNEKIPFSTDIRTRGVEADLLISVEFSESVKGSTVATASGYEFEEYSGRPIVGLVQYNKNFTVKKNAIKGNLDTAIHEIAHILAFNSEYFSEFIDPITLTKIPRDRVLMESKVNGVSRKVLITPNVVRAARKHFGCDKIEGMDLENHGEDGNDFSHWKERLMYGDIMIGENGTEDSISEITLAVFDDSGWYRTNAFTGALFSFGLNQGCAFFEEKCVENGVTQFKNDYCVGAGESNCDPSHRQRTFCSIKTFDKDVPCTYQHFSNPRLGGSQPLAEFCPLPLKIADDVDELKNNCIYGQKNPLPEIAEYETIGVNSACFVSNVYDRSKRTYNWAAGKDFNSACYEFRCNEAERIVEVSVGGKFYKCPREGGAIEVSPTALSKGTIQCMDFNLVCNQTVKCDNIYDCAIKESMRRADLRFDYKSRTIGSGSNL